MGNVLWSRGAYNKMTIQQWERVEERVCVPSYLQGRRQYPSPLKGLEASPTVCSEVLCWKGREVEALLCHRTRQGP